MKWFDTAKGPGESGMEARHHELEIGVRAGTPAEDRSGLTRLRNAGGGSHAQHVSSRSMVAELTDIAAAVHELCDAVPSPGLIEASFSLYRALLYLNDVIQTTDRHVPRFSTVSRGIAMSVDADQCERHGDVADAPVEDLGRSIRTRG
jgi:hypothetical protein